MSVVNSIKRSRSTSINNGNIYNRIDFKCICATFSKQYTQHFYKLLIGRPEWGQSRGSCNFGYNLPVIVPNCHRAKIHVFLRKNFESRRTFTICSPVFTFPLRILLKQKNLTQKRQNHNANTVLPLKALDERKRLRFGWQLKDLLLYFFSADFGHFFSSNVHNVVGVMLRGQGTRNFFVSEIAQQLHRRDSDVPNIYSTLLDAAAMYPTLALNENTKSKRRFPSHSNYGCQKLQRLYIQSGAAHGYMRFLVKISNLPIHR